MAFWIYDRPIGSNFIYNGIVYGIEEAQNEDCTGCAFENNEKLCEKCPYHCTKDYRFDGKYVIFKNLTIGNK